MKKIFTLLTLAVLLTMGVNAQQLVVRNGQAELVKSDVEAAVLPQLKQMQKAAPKTGSDSLWTSLGMATYTDDLVTAYFSKPNYTYPVEIQECDTLPGYFRLVDPYASYPGVTSSLTFDTSEVHYMYIHAENPSQVYIEHYAQSGLKYQTSSSNYGNLRMSSMAGYRIAAGTSAQPSEWGTLDTNLGTITFPYQKLLSSFDNYNGNWAIANKNTAFCVQLPGYPVYSFNYSLADLFENSDSTATQRIVITPDVDSDFYGFRYGIFSAADLNANIDSCAATLFGANATATITANYCDVAIADSGITYILIVAATPNGTPAGHKVVSVNYSPAKYWTSLGTYTLRDGLIHEFFAGVNPVSWEVEVQQYTAHPTLFRVKDPYLNYPVQFNSETRYQGRYVMGLANGASLDTIPSQKLGLEVTGYGEFAVRSYLHGNLDTVHHELTFPTNGLVFTIPSMGSYYANSENKFLLAKIDTVFNLQLADSAITMLERHTDSLRWSSDYPDVTPLIISSNTNVVTIQDYHTCYAVAPGTATVYFYYAPSFHHRAELDSLMVTVEEDTNIVVATVENTVLQNNREYDGTDICTVLTPGTLSTVNPGFANISVQASATFADANVGTGKDITIRYKVIGPDAEHYLLTDTLVTRHDGVINAKQLSIPELADDSLMVGLFSNSACSNLPTYTLYNYSLTEQLYRSNIINHEAGELNAIDFFYATHDQISRGVKVYMKNLPDHDSTFTASNMWIDFLENDIVYEGSLSAADSGAIRINLAQPFAYAGGNLLVAICDTTGDWSGRQFHSFNTGYNSAFVAYSDDMRPTCSNLSNNSFTGSKYNYTQLANAAFHFTPAYTSITVDNKVYDGTTDATIAIDAVEGIVNNENVQVIANGTFADANIGTKPVFVSYTLTGADAANYQAPANDTLSATIVPKQLTINGTEVADYKAYDGTTTCAIATLGTLEGLVNNDSVSLNATAVFDNAAKGLNKDVTVTYTLGATDTNYLAPESETLVSSIVSDSIYVTVATADGTKGSTLPVPGYYIFSADSSLTITPTANNGYMFLYWVVRKNGTVIDTNYTISPTIDFNYTMCDSSYSYTAVFDVEHTVYRLQFTCTGTGEGMAYRPTNNQKNLCSTELVVDSAAALDLRFKPSANCKLRSLTINGTDRTADLTIPMFGAQIFRDTALADMTIVAEFDSIVALTVNGTVVVLDKVFDNNDTAIVTSTGTLQGLRAGDDVTLNAEAHYSQVRPGDSLTVTVNYAISGSDISWYTLAQTDATLYGSIAPKQLTINGSYISDKTYDGTDEVSVLSRHMGTVEGIVEGTNVGCNFFHVRYADRNAGVDKPVYASYTTLGSDADCYINPAPDTMTASIYPKQLYVAGTILDTAKVYDGTTRSTIVYPGYIMSGKIAGDTLSLSASANYVSKNAGSHIRIVSSYSFVGPQGNNYVGMDDSTHFGTITPRQLYASGAEIQLAKEYDGNDTAIVLTPATMDTLVAIDDVTPVTTATYDDSTVAHNKTITIHYALEGYDAANYICPEGGVYSNEGKIILPTELDTLNEEGELLSVEADGYCQDNEGWIKYHIGQGEPSEYKLVFSEDARLQGFANTSWIAIPADEQIFFDVPENCMEGDYLVEIIFKNEANVETNPIPVTFVVNLNKNYMVQLYNDVISIDNTTERFTTYQWYKDGEPIKGATLPYYQEKGGLTGNYFVRVNIGMETEARTCEKFFESEGGNQAVYVYPNPVVTSTKVKLQGFAEGEHMMKVYNSYGVEMMTITFSGAEYNFDMTRLPQGTYMVSVDGITAKAMKY